MPDQSGRVQSGWDYTAHPGDCHEHAEGGAWTTCCRECAGTGVFPVPWVDSVEQGRDDPDASCVACKSSGRTIVGLSAPAGGLSEPPHLPSPVQ